MADHTPDPSTMPPIPPTPLPPRNPTEPSPQPPPQLPPEPQPEPPVPAGTSGSPDAELTTVGQDGFGQDGVGQDGFGGNGTIPTFDDVRSKIESRIARAGGQTELDEAGAEGRQRAQTEEQRAKAAQDALDRIRASMRND